MTRQTELRPHIITGPRTELRARVEPLAELADSITEVPLVDGTSTRFVNFDYAASAPPLASVHAAVSSALSYYASIHRGQSYLSRVSTAAYEQARHTVALHVGARSDDLVIITRNTTDALNLLASAVPGPVLHFDFEHHANLLPWSRGEDSVLIAADSLDASLAALDARLELAVLDSEPFALVAITGASNVTGEVPPLQAIAGIAHRHGARLAVDGAQLVPHRRVDLAADGVDYLACSGHKLYAPYGAGALIGRPDWLDAAEPHQRGGGAVVEVGLASVAWKSGAARHEGGTPNLVGAVALAAAFRSLEQIGFGLIGAHEQVLYGQLLDGLDRLGIEVLRIWPDHDQLVGVASFNVPHYPADLVAAYLSAECGIGVRGGRFCAHPLLDRLGLGSDGAVRASIGLGTSSEDVELLLHALERLIYDGPSWGYAEHNGYVSPDPDPRPPAERIARQLALGV